MAAAGDVPDTDRRPPEHARPRRLERTDCQREEVRGQRRGLRKVDDASARRRLLTLDGAVRHRVLAVAHGDRGPEARLERGLVETGKDTPRVRGLALREGVATAGRGRSVEPAEVLVQAPGEAKDEHHVAGRERPGE